MSDKTPRLHIHGQRQPHDEVFIIGTREGLIQLCDAVNQALLNKNQPIRFDTFTADGEGFSVILVRNTDEPNDPNGYWEQGILPYGENQDRKLHPRELTKS